MSHRFLRTRSLAVSSLVLIVAGGLAAAACGSDEKDPTTADDPLNPGNGNQGMGNGGSGNGGGSADPSNPPSSMNGGTSSNTEGQGGETPIDNNPDDNPPGSSNGGSANPGDPPVDPPTGLAPNCNPPEGAVPDLTLTLVADGLDDPLFVTGVPNDDTRLFIVEQSGTVRIVQNGTLLEQPFISVGGQIINLRERGLLGLAFHPNYPDNGLFYLHFSSSQGATNGDGLVVEYSVDANNPNLANAGSARTVLAFNDGEENHNGGNLVFGPDGFLWIGMGDEGGGNDNHGPIGNGQNLNTLFGKMLRIDPLGRSVNNAYSVPDGNLAQATGQQALPEIWAYGLRNPWRYSFDACTGDLYIGDVGQGAQEEIDFLPANANRVVAPGTNFGWRIMEGPACRPGEANCNAQTQAGLVLPVDSYGRGVGSSVTGGHVYRGSSVPGLRGTYIYADYNSARFFRFRIQNGAIADKVEITDQMRPAGGGNIDEIASFGSDNAGEMYVAARVPGAVYRVSAAQ